MAKREKWIIEITPGSGFLPNTYEQYETLEQVKEAARSYLMPEEEVQYWEQLTDWDGKNPLVLDLCGETLLAYKEEN